MPETPNSKSSVSTKLERIAELAKQMPGVPLTSLAHHIDIVWMQEAYRRVRKTGAPGVDGQTAAEYAQQLQGNLKQLLDRAKSGDHYRAPPVRRVHIPKGNGGTRPLGVPTFEDKVLQKAIAMVLEAVYEQDFQECSYGFRPKRGAHEAIEALWKHTMDMGGGWLLEADIEKFFDNVDHGKLREVLSQRVRDGVIHRLVGKWLNAGVMEEGNVSYPDSGTPQGGVISPLLANIYLHEVLDLWWARDVVPRLRGRAALVRYADDFVMVFQLESDAQRVNEILAKRFAKYGLRLHPDKTRLIPFQRPLGPPKGKGPDSFDFLGFTHHWGMSRKGAWVVKRKTAKDRFKRTVKRINEWCRDNRHSPLEDQHRELSRKLKGHDAYYGITGNSRALGRLRFVVENIWRKWLHRRSWKGRTTWQQMARLLRVFPLPPARTVHSVCRAANP